MRINVTNFINVKAGMLGLVFLSTWVVIVFGCGTLCASFLRLTAMKLVIDKQWDSQPTGHGPVTLALSWQPGDAFLTCSVLAPFFDDPRAPDGLPGKPFPGLWEHEVVEVFFLGNDDKYLEVELCPYGHHLVLLLNGTRNMIKDELPLKFESSIDRSTSTWSGTAQIPLAYFPHGVSKINAYSIHGGENVPRMYEALYPAPLGKHVQPDFHRLEYFQPFAFSNLVLDLTDVGKYWDSL